MANRKRNIQIKFYVTEDAKTAHRRKKMASYPHADMALTSARWRLTDISSIRTPQISRHLPKSFPPLVGISTRLPSGSTPEVLRIRPTWTRYGKGWMRYGSYKDTSYQVNAESSH